MNLKEFADPSKTYRPIPVWAWNETIEPTETETRIREMKRKGFGGFFIEGRDGLRTRYLGEEWMRAVRRSVEAARESKVECWLTDDDRGPSGGGGGLVTDSDDTHFAFAISWFADAGAVDAGLREYAVAYTVPDGDGHRTLDGPPEDLDGAGVFIARRAFYRLPIFNGGNFTDVLDPAVTAAFIESTHEVYLKQFKYDFGEFLPGIHTRGFTAARPNDIFGEDDTARVSFPWTGDFAAFFESLHGYSPLIHLHHLLDGSEAGFTFRCHFYQAVAERFLQSFTIPLSAWCHEHNLKLAGGKSSAGFSSMVLSGGADMPHMEYMDIPGVDVPGPLPTDTIPLRQAASVARQLGRSRVFASCLGGAGHDTAHLDIKRAADRCFAAGITSLSPDTLPFSLTGTRKRSAPALSYHQPGWTYARVIADYLARCSWAVAQGDGTAEVLVLMPVDSAYGALDVLAPGGGDAVAALDGSFRALIDELSAAHIAFDLGDERIINRYGASDGPAFTVGKAAYRAVVFPPALTWRSTTLEKLDAFTGTMLLMGDMPGRIDGEVTDRAAAFFDRDTVVGMADDPTAVAEQLRSRLGASVTVTGPDGGEDRGVIVNHRRDAGAHLVFIADTTGADARTVSLAIPALGGVVELDPFTGRAYRYDAVVRDGATIIQTVLHPHGSRIFLVDQTQTSVEGAAPAVDEEPLTIVGPYVFQRMHDNILVLDRCTLDIDGETVMKDCTVAQARAEIWRRTGIAKYDRYQPWAIEQMNVRTQTNRTRLTFTFTVEDIPEAISIAVESAARFDMTINGTTLEAVPGRWHIDRHIPAANLESLVTAGENTVVLSGDVLWDTEIEAIQIFGRFALGPAERGLPIIREPEAFDTGSWTDQGYPFFGGSFIYKTGFDLDLSDGARYELDLSGGRGGMFHISVNGIEVGAVSFPPWRGEITGALKDGPNTVEIEVVGSLRNTLGPFAGASDGPVETAIFTDDAPAQRVFRHYGFIEAPKLVKMTER